MKRIMIVGASSGQVPLIKKAKELGYYVAVTDLNPNAIGITLADVFYNVSTIDEEALLEAAKKFKPDGITTMQTDMPVRAIARVNEELGLCGLNRKTAIRATDKIEMIKCFKKNKVASPWYYVINNNLDEVKSQFTYPCIFKPADNSASRGVCLVNSYTEINSAFEYSKKFSRGGQVLVEEYMQGPEVSVEVLVWRGDVYPIAVTDKLTTGSPFFVEMGHKEPSALPEVNIKAIKELAVMAINAVGLENGEGHVEIILTSNGPKVVELGARLGGDFITSDLVTLSTGVDMLKETLRIACGEKPDTKLIIKKGSAIRFIEADVGIITKIVGIDNALNIPGVNRIEFFKGIGDESAEIHNSLDRIGYIIAQGDTGTEAMRICELAQQKIFVEVNHV